ncbi:DoxX family protein [Pollutibacter soli]|uniref:DoxX family protein n=1 Tax=Pollutibacter soli TaxID=3034157 RepID=UPI003013C4ED
MNLIQRLEKWGDTHHPKWLDFIRIVLGIFLFLKGLEFVNNMDQLTNTISSGSFMTAMSAGVLAHYVVFAHIIGGILIAFGLLTRFACIIQIPILLGALFVVNAQGGIFTPFTEIWMAILVLLLLGFFLIEGSGPISVDHYMGTHTEKEGGVLKK